MKVLNQHQGSNFTLYNGDSCEIMKGLPDNSLDYSIFSPPFIDLYTYSDSLRDLSNNRGEDEFFYQFGIIVEELARTIKPGRLVSVHCMDLPTSKYKDGFIGLKDFPGQIIKLFQDKGFIYHSRVSIWKDPVVAMQRTKALGLLHKQIKKDSSMSRQGIADYIITFRNQGENTEHITNTNESFPVDLWQQYASPVWMDIKQSNTLQKQSARAEKDEKHISPLQLDLIERCVKLWSNEGDVVFTPFMGIGSEVYQALLMERKGVGIELKESYYQQAVKNCEYAEEKPQEVDLFEGLD
ncbi:DNA-methyltransferase [Enterococcus olivae]